MLQAGEYPFLNDVALELCKFGHTAPDTLHEEFGELLWPDKITTAHLQSLQFFLGTYRYAGQYQERPAPAEGGILKRHWWRYWQPRGLPPVLVKLLTAPSKHRKALEGPSRLDCQIPLEKESWVGWGG